jgi:heme a synthase
MRLHRYAALLVGCTFLLLLAGGLVTSHCAGLSVPDWPTTYGWSMFTFPFSKWVGGIVYEHGHRLIASTVGFLTIGLAAWIWLAERRRWMKRLAILALAAVVTQGVLGGVTVLMKLPLAVSVAHAGLAQIFFCLAVSIALFTSAGWQSAYGGAATPDDAGLRRITAATTAAVYLQILMGAAMRHTMIAECVSAGAAIPDFPLAFGRLVPPMPLLGTWPVAIHFAHRVGALAVAIFIGTTLATVFRRHASRPELLKPATLLALLALTQITLGGLVVLSGRDPVINTLHVGLGALVLATSLVLTLRAHRGRFAAPEAARERERPAGAPLGADLKGARG